MAAHLLHLNTSWLHFQVLHVHEVTENAQTNIPIDFSTAKHQPHRNEGSHSQDYRLDQSRTCTQGRGTPNLIHHCCACVSYACSAPLAAATGLAEASRAGFGGKGLAEPESRTLISDLFHKDITRCYNSR